MRKVIVDEWMSLDGVVPSLKLSAGVKQTMSFVLLRRHDS
jgi:hypothetical protein